VAGKNLPLFMIVTTTFATWFGSETVLGIPAKFIKGGFHALIEDPFGAGTCLILVGFFFASRLYRMNLLTISDFYRERFGSTVEIICSILIMLSYLGWVSAQVTALGLIFNVLSNGLIPIEAGMCIGVISILAYTIFGGMWSIAITDFIQMIILVVGLSSLAYIATDLAGGFSNVLTAAHQRNLFIFFPEGSFKELLFFIGSAITMMLGSIPQQDVFQRVMSSKNIQAAKWGPILGGIFYIGFAFVPMYIAISTFVIMPQEATQLLATDAQAILPTLVMTKMPFIMQVVFFGALLSAIKSTASATLLAPSITFVENIWYQIKPPANPKEQLVRMRLTVLIFSCLVLCYAIIMRGKPIYELVSEAYQVTLVGSFIPLSFGLYWKRATTQGAILSMVGGIVAWLLFGMTWLGDVFPAELAGFLISLILMVIGSTVYQYIKPQHGEHRIFDEHGA
ncbi:sodium:solute symporter, partial [bacterium]|nr:sodium:solute symporter [bacterium]